MLLVISQVTCNSGHHTHSPKPLSDKLGKAISLGLLGCKALGLLNGLAQTRLPSVFLVVHTGVLPVTQAGLVNLVNACPRQMHFGSLEMP